MKGRLAGAVLAPPRDGSNRLPPPPRSPPQTESLWPPSMAQQGPPAGQCALASVARGRSGRTLALESPRRALWVCPLSFHLHCCLRVPCSACFSSVLPGTSRKSPVLSAALCPVVGKEQNSVSPRSSGLTGPSPRGHEAGLSQRDLPSVPGDVGRGSLPGGFGTGFCGLPPGGGGRAPGGVSLGCALPHLGGRGSIPWGGVGGAAVSVLPFKTCDLDPLHAPVSRLNAFSVTSRSLDCLPHKTLLVCTADSHACELSVGPGRTGPR